MVVSVTPSADVMTTPNPTSPVGTLDRLARYYVWKEQHVPLLYDWLSSRTLAWPHGAVQWGIPSNPINGDATRRQLSSHQFTTRPLFLAERTDANNNPNDPNTLLQYDVRVTNILVNKPMDIAKPWVEESNTNERSSNDFVLRKRILHPGEVNRIRLVSSSVVITHTDSPNLLVWDMDAQPDRKRNETTPSRPSCVLKGHEKNAEYAIDVSPGRAKARSAHDASIVSGGSDHNVLLWRLRDYESRGMELLPSVRMLGASDSLSYGASSMRHIGHTDVVEDVSFHAKDASIIVSVGRDAAMALWDARQPSRPVHKVMKAHNGDVNCCDAGGGDGNLILTGGSDCEIRVWDYRKFQDGSGKSTPLRTLRGHSGQITGLTWNQYETNVFASGAEDGEVLVWRINGNDGSETVPISKDIGHSSELLFRHVGHTLTEAKITDLDWLPHASDRWCLSSLSESLRGGSTVQIWRMSDLIHRPREEVMEELRTHATEEAAV